jgi:antitoxin ParD1/3/4
MPKRISLNISITPQNQRYINARVRSGRYQSASELIRDALVALANRESLDAKQAREWRNKIAEGIAQADRGEFIDGEEAFRRLAELDALEAQITKPRRSRKTA